MKKSTQNFRKTSMFPKTLGETVGQLTKPLMKKHGLPDGLIPNWHHIAGADLASYCTPVGCKRSKKESAATLIIEVLPSHSLIAQHASGVLVEKINLHYGYQVVSRIQFKPGMGTMAPRKKPASKEQQTMASQFQQLADDLRE